ncbi:ParA family protein [Staphylococcus xylosus]|uniref:ParA family protein n=1 Tax=Staphylococcus xylosus TaxID=1288 RepID=UPI0036AF3565
MKIVTFSAMDGGVGKTTLCFNFAEYLAFNGKRVLLLDKDHKMHLSRLYQQFDQDNTVANIYTGGDVDIEPIKENLDLIRGYIRLDEIQKLVDNDQRTNMLFYMWLEDNFNSKNLSQYDYIIIDTHPDFGVFTKNAIAPSHAIITPVIDSDDSDASNLEGRLMEYKEENIDFKTRESNVTAKLLRVGNKVTYNTIPSVKFKKHMENDDRYINYMPSKSVLNQTILDKKSYVQKLADNELKHNDKKFEPEFNKIMEEIKNAIDEI